VRAVGDAFETRLPVKKPPVASHYALRGASDTENNMANI